MASAKDIRRRIRTVKNIQKITNAMKMVAAARLRKAQDRAEAARPYAAAMRRMVQNAAAGAGDISHPLLEVREERSSVFVVIGADRGLAGSYNANVMQAALRAIGDRDPETVKLALVGKKAVSFFRRRPYGVLDNVENLGSAVGFGDIAPIARRVRSLFESCQTDAAYLVYARFITPMRQQPAVVRLLPMEPPEARDCGSGDFEFEPPAADLLASLLPRYVDTQLYQALVEAQASEHGARMTAMSAATENAGEMLDALTLMYNKARQAAITSEILEVVTAAEALK